MSGTTEAREPESLFLILPALLRGLRPSFPMTVVEPLVQGTSFRPSAACLWAEWFAAVMRDEIASGAVAADHVLSGRAAGGNPLGILLALSIAVAGLEVLGRAGGGGAVAAGFPGMWSERSGGSGGATLACRFHAAKMGIDCSYTTGTPPCLDSRCW